ncbi:MAG TPA: patatin-like phospholipase family protein [Acetobacteraceae bacterium]|nr:patatin-like phospholipase family protein [Acetobacteraceae bacterium]
MSETLSQDEWINRVLGISYSRTTPSKNQKQVKFAPIPTNIPPPDGSGIRLGQSRARSKNASITPPPPPLQPNDFIGDGGRKITIAKSPKGGTLFTSPSPPVREITFSGGGGKGAALPGAVKALEDGGILKDATKIAGASVGSMTAALVAAGITAKEFTDVANQDATTAQITEGTGGTKMGLLLRTMENRGSPLTGQGLEDVVRDVLDETLRKRIMEYVEQCGDAGKAPDKTVTGIAKDLSGNKAGPTFLNYRQLSKVIPAIKEIVITGTYTTEFETEDDEETDGKGKQGAGNEKKKLKKVKDGNELAQLYVFDADSEPDMQVAIAVHASASFPGAFKPVDIALSTGMTVRFIDGGVMNNTPTSSSIGNERKLDPMPDRRGMTFVFEDEDTSAGLLKGKVTPKQGKMAQIMDWVVGADNAAAEYAKNRDMTDRPEEIVVVPLQLTLPPKKGGKKEQHFDMRGMMSGTLNFNLPMDAKLGFQQKTEKATNEQIEREKQPKTQEFASDSQMFVSISMADLKTLKTSGYPGAGDALVFRERVTEMIEKLVEAVKNENAKDGGRTANVLKDKNATMALDELDTLAGKNIDFQGYVGREMNRGPLDGLLDAIRKGGPKSDAMAATFAVSDALKAHTYADNVLKQLVYPKMKREREGGAGIETLLVVEGLLRAAKAPDDVNDALTIAIKHFRNKSDKSLPHRGHKKFAQELQRRMMPKAA